MVCDVSTTLQKNIQVPADVVPSLPLYGQLLKVPGYKDGVTDNKPSDNIGDGTTTALRGEQLNPYGF